MNLEITDSEVITEWEGFKISAPVDQFFQAITPSERFRSHLVRYESANVCVVEFSPRYVTVKNTGGAYGNLGSEEIFQLPMPWIVVVYKQNDMYLFCRRGQLESLDDPVFHLPLPHIRTDGHPCWGDNWQHLDSKAPLVDQAVYMTQQFFLSGFRGGMYYNTDEPNRDKFLPAEVKDIIAPSGLWMNQVEYFHWLEEKTPMDMCQLSYQPAGSLRSFITLLSGGVKTKLMDYLISLIRSLPGVQVKR